MPRLPAYFNLWWKTIHRMKCDVNSSFTTITTTTILNTIKNNNNNNSMESYYPKIYSNNKWWKKREVVAGAGGKWKFDIKYAGGLWMELYCGHVVLLLHILRCIFIILVFIQQFLSMCMYVANPSHHQSE